MGKGSPDAPNPKETAAAQTGSNVSTSVANAFLNNVSQSTPYGSLTYSPTGSYSWTDPSTNQTYDIPTFTASQTLTPAGQKLQSSTMATQQNLADTAKSASGTLQRLLGQQIDLSDAPKAGTVPTYQTVGNTNFSQDRRRVEQAIMDRAASGLDSDRKSLEQRLADQGIAIGSEAYQSAMGDYNRQVNDMRTSAILAGGDEQSRLANLAIQRAGFNNQAMGQQYSTQQDARNQYLTQAYGNRNQSLNEILSLMSGSQVQSPSFVNTAQSMIPNTDYAGIVQQDYQNRLASSQNGIGGGILGLFGSLGGAALGNTSLFG